MSLSPVGPQAFTGFASIPGLIEACLAFSAAGVRSCTYLSEYLVGQLAFSHLKTTGTATNLKIHKHGQRTEESTSWKQWNMLGQVLIFCAENLVVKNKHVNSWPLVTRLTYGWHAVICILVPSCAGTASAGSHSAWPPDLPWLQAYHSTFSFIRCSIWNCWTLLECHENLNGDFLMGVFSSFTHLLPRHSWQLGTVSKSMVSWNFCYSDFQLSSLMLVTFWFYHCNLLIDTVL